MAISKEVIQILIKARDEASGKLNRMSKNLKKNSTLTENRAKKIDAYITAQKKLNSAISAGQKPFAGYAMSLMFAGMALQRIFQGIAKFGISAFKEIEASMEGTTNGAVELDGAMKYLGYTVGSALEPLLEWLIPIIDTLSVWADDNPKLVATIIGAGGLVGSILAIGGATKLALDGVTGLSSALNAKLGMGLGKTLSFGFGLYYAGSAINSLIEGEVVKSISEGFKSAGMFAYVSGASKGTVAALFGIGMAMEIVDTLVKGGGKLTKDSLASLFIGNAPGAFIVSTGVGAALLTIGVAIELMDEGQWERFKNTAEIMFLGLVNGIAMLVENTIIAPFVALINSVITTANSLGANIPKLKTDIFSSGISAEIRRISNEGAYIVPPAGEPKTQYINVNIEKIEGNPEEFLNFMERVSSQYSVN